MIAKIYIDGEIGADVTLIDVMTQFKNFANPESVEVHINSVGGSVSVGTAIYEYLRALPMPVKTIATMAYSIAANIFMAGSERVVPAGADRLMIHFPFVMGFTGGSEDLADMSKQLKALESEMVQFYKGHLDIDEATLTNLLKEDTFISGDEAFTLGFATTLDLPLQAVAYFKERPSKEEVITNIDKKTIMTKFEELIQSIKNFGKAEEADVVALVLQDANGVEITFPDVAEDAMPAIGDMATVEGEPANGEYVSPTGEKWIFTEGSLSEIVPAEEEPETEEAKKAREAQEEADRLAAEAEAAEVLNAEDVEKLLEELFAKITKDAKEALAEAQATFDAKLEKVETDNKAEIVALKKLIGSPEIDEPKPQKKSNSLANVFRN